MRYFLFVLLFIFSTQGFSKEMLISCTDNKSYTTLYRIVNNEVYQRWEGEWRLYRGEKSKGYTRTVKIKPGKIIILTSYSVFYTYNSDVFDLKEMTWSHYSTLKDHSEPSTKLATMQCEAL